MATTCVSPAKLTAFLAGQLSADEDRVVADHLDRCPRCEGLAADLSDDEQARELAAAAEGKQPAGAANEPQVEDLCRRLHALGLYEMAEDSSSAIAEDAAGNGDEESTHDTHSFIGKRPVQTAVVNQRGDNRVAAVPTKVEDAPTEAAAGQPAADAPRFKRLGRYDIVRTLGAGTFGIVYLAHDTRLNRSVALKIARATVLADDHLRLRFVREAETLAKLQHPHIVPVYEADEVEGLCYLVIAYCDGPTLDAWLQEQAGPLEARLAVRLLLPLVDAVEHAHAHGVLHRDIKPANVILERAAGDADGLTVVPRLTDFGLAKVVEEKTSSTLSGIVLGTAQYMAPEQAAGHVERIGPPTDVYALGAVLYQMLTGRPPIEGNTTLDTLRRLLIDEPAEIRRLQPGVPADLDAIVLRCLNKTVTDRYATAAELSADLRRFLDGQQTVARPLTVQQRAGRWVRRNPTGVGLLALTLCVVLLTSGLYYYAHLLRDSQQQVEAQWQAGQARDRALAEAARRNTDWDYVHRIQSAARAAFDGDVRSALTDLDRTQPELRGLSYWYLQALCTQSPLDRVEIGAEVYQIRLSPDRRELAAVGIDRVLRLYDAHTLALIKASPTGQDEINGVAYSPDGRWIATGGDDGTFRLFSLVGEENPPAFRNYPSEESKKVYGLAFYAGSSKLAICGHDSIVRLRRAANGELIKELKGHSGIVEALAVSPDGKLLATASNDHTAILWDLVAEKPLKTLAGHADGLSSVAFSPDGKWLATGGLDKAVCLWDVASRRRVRLAKHHDGIQAVAFSDDSRWLYAGDRGGMIRQYRIEVGPSTSPDVTLEFDAPYDTWTAHEDRVWSLIPGVEPGTMFSSGRDGWVRRWGAGSRPRVSRDIPSTPGDTIVDLAFAQDGGLLLLLHESSGVEVRDARTLEARPALTSRFARWSALQVLEDRGEVAAGNAHGVVAIWSLRTGECRRVFNHPHENFTISGIVYSPSAGLLGVLPFDAENVRLHHVDREDFYRELPTSNHSAAAFSPDGARLAVDSLDDIYLYDVATQKLLRTLRGHTNAISGLAFSPEGDLLASASADRGLRLWTAPGNFFAQIGSHRHGLADAQFTPDGKTLVSIDDAGVLRLTHLPTQSTLLDIPTNTRRLRKLALAPDSRRLAVLRDDHSVLLIGVAESP